MRTIEIKDDDETTRIFLTCEVVNKDTAPTAPMYKDVQKIFVVPSCSDSTFKLIQEIMEGQHDIHG